MKTLSELVVMRVRMDAILAGEIDAKVRFALELSRTELLNAIRAQSVMPEVLRAA